MRRCMHPLPVELLNLVLGYLEAHDLGRLSQTCRELQSQCDNAQLWRSLLVHDFALSIEAMAALPHHPKHTYLHRLTGACAHYGGWRRRNENDATARDKARLALAWEQQPTHRWCDILFGVRAWLVVTGACGLSTSAMLLSSSTEHGALALIPVWVWLAYVLISIVASVVLFRTRAHSSLWDVSSNPAVRAVVWFSDGASNAPRLVTCTLVLVCLLAVAFTALLAVKSGGATLSWKHVFAPLLALLSVSACLVWCTAGSTASTSREVMGYTLCWCMFIPWLVFAALLCVWLDEDDDDGSLTNVFSPLFVQIAGFYLIVLGAAWSGGLEALCLCSSSTDDDDDWENKQAAGPPYEHLLVWCAILCLMGVPIVVFESLVVRLVDHSEGSWTGVLVPVVVWFALLTLLAVAAAWWWVDDNGLLTMWKAARRRAPQPHLEEGEGAAADDMEAMMQAVGVV